MATFAKATFNAAVYSSFRPTYPKKLFNEIFDYHRKSDKALWDLAVDIGCGTGQATGQLGGPFRKVIGIDPSQTMLQAARANFKHVPGSTTNFSFIQGHAANLNMLKDDSVDLVISAQASHWFDWQKVWPETARVLRKGGSVAFWVYAEFRLSEFPSVTPMITAYAQGTDPATSLGTYFERPGRTTLENMLTEVPNPKKMDTVLRYGSGLGRFERRYFSGQHFPPHLRAPLPSQLYPVEMRKTMRWRDLLGYFRTWSALHNFHQKFPEDLERVDERFPEDRTVAPDASIYSGEDEPPVDVDVAGGDIAVRFWKDLRDEAKKQGGRYGVDDPVSVEWPIALLLAKKL